MVARAAAGEGQSERIEVNVGFANARGHRAARELATLDSLRRFRDESMSATPPGRGLVGLYYRISPPVAETLERHPESYTPEVTRPIVQTCAALSSAQDETGSRLQSALLGAVLTQLYVVGIITAAAGHACIRLRELLRRSE